MNIVFIINTYITLNQGTIFSSEACKPYSWSWAKHCIFTNFSSYPKEISVKWTTVYIWFENAFQFINLNQSSLVLNKTYTFIHNCLYFDFIYNLFTWNEFAFNYSNLLFQWNCIEINWQFNVCYKWNSSTQILFYRKLIILEKFFSIHL